MNNGTFTCQMITDAAFVLSEEHLRLVLCLLGEHYLNEKLFSRADISSVVSLDSRDKMHYIKSIVRGHLTPGWLHLYDVESNQVVDSLEPNSKLRFTKTWTHEFFHPPLPQMLVNCAPILDDTVTTTNGIVHVIDRVLTPVNRNLWQLIENDPRFSIMKSLAGNETQVLLSNSEKLSTLLAFTDDAVNKLPEAERDKAEIKDVEPEVAKALLSNQIATGKLFIPEDDFEADVETLNHDKFRVTYDWQGLDQDPQIACMDIRQKNIETCDGIIHFVPKPLPVYKGTLMDQLRKNENFSEFVRLAEAAGVDKRLEDPSTQSTLLLFTNDDTDDDFLAFHLGS
ncbi:unnamed protein product [Soboliphyme baturini]|uniref:FAS1 domain-containing protein n=1 Tax=Soboliphyme baturini TaxID=241478 RepID=A0A183IDM4_9BILA|nr:unnamed protein product [Soboliphyme baturini]